MEGFLFRPRGLLDPVSWRKIRWISTRRMRIKGRMKWNVKNRVRVTPVTANPPQTHSTKVFPQIGMAEKKLVITVAAQKLIWPQGRT